MTLLVACQFITGLGLTMYCVPSPRLAFDSVRFIMSELPLGWMLRGLHYWGASFLVVASVVHMLRVFFFGSYKAPRELTWLSGLTMLMVILGFSLSGYLLPWDQKAYWATTVTINIARGTPIIGEAIANVLRGGADLGALTLGRWYSAHVFLLPAVLVVLIVDAHRADAETRHLRADRTARRTIRVVLSLARDEGHGDDGGGVCVAHHGSGAISRAPR